MSRGRGFPLSPPRENRNTPDETKVLETIDPYDIVLSLDEVKTQLPVNHDNYNVKISRLMRSVTDQIQDYIGQDFLKKRVKSYWRNTPRYAKLARGPHGDILSVTVIDVTGQERTLEQGKHFKVRGMQRKELYDFEYHGQLFVEYESGVDNKEIISRVTDAVLQELSLQFKNRQDPDSPPMTSVNSLSLEARHLLSGLIRRAL